MSDNPPSEAGAGAPAGSAFANVPFTFNAPTGAPAAPAFPAFGTPEGGKGKKAGEDEESDDEEVPPEVKARLDFLKTLAEKREKIMEQYRLERAVLESKYQALYAPLFEKRADVVAGRLDVKAAEDGTLTEVPGFPTPAAPAEETSDKETDKDKEEKDKGPKRGVPDFWLTALVHHDMLSAMLAEEDIPALHHLTDIKCIDQEDHQGFKLEFHFSPNAFFSNSVLTKAYHIPNLLDNAAEPALENVEGTAIEWKEGKNLTVKMQKMRPKGKRGGPPVVKQVPKESFFNFFAPLPIPDEDNDEEEEYEEAMGRIEYDYQLGMSFRLQLVPDALKWYEGGDDDSDDEEEEDDDEEDEDDDEDDEEDDSEEEDEAETESDSEEEEDQRRPPRNARHGKTKNTQQQQQQQQQGGNPGGAAATGEQQECKQS